MAYLGNVTISDVFSTFFWGFQIFFKNFSIIIDVYLYRLYYYCLEVSIYSIPMYISLIHLHHFVLVAYIGIYFSIFSNLFFFRFWGVPPSPYTCHSFSKWLLHIAVIIHNHHCHYKRQVRRSKNLNITNKRNLVNFNCLILSDN